MRIVKIVGFLAINVIWLSYTWWYCVYNVHACGEFRHNWWYLRLPCFDLCVCVRVRKWKCRKKDSWILLSIKFFWGIFRKCMHFGSFSLDCVFANSFICHFSKKAPIKRLRFVFLQIINSMAFKSANKLQMKLIEQNLQMKRKKMHTSHILLIFELAFFHFFRSIFYKRFLFVGNFLLFFCTKAKKLYIEMISASALPPHSHSLTFLLNTFRLLLKSISLLFARFLSIFACLFHSVSFANPRFSVILASGQYATGKWERRREETATVMNLLICLNPLCKMAKMMNSSGKAAHNETNNKFLYHIRQKLYGKFTVNRQMQLL